MNRIDTNGFFFKPCYGLPTIYRCAFDEERKKELESQNKKDRKKLQDMTKKITPNGEAS